MTAFNDAALIALVPRNDLDERYAYFLLSKPRRAANTSHGENLDTTYQERAVAALLRR